MGHYSYALPSAYTFDPSTLNFEKFQSPEMPQKTAFFFAAENPVNYRHASFLPPPFSPLFKTPYPSITGPISGWTACNNVKKCQKASKMCQNVSKRVLKVSERKCHRPPWNRAYNNTIHILHTHFVTVWSSKKKKTRKWAITPTPFRRPTLLTPQP